MLTVTINSKFQNEYKKSPLFFLKRITETQWNSSSRSYYTENKWVSTMTAFTSNILYNELPDNSNFHLMAPDDINLFNHAINNEGPERMFSVHPVRSSSVNDTYLIFYQVIYRHLTSPDAYRTMELLWFLNFKGVNVSVLKEALSGFEPQHVSLLLKYIRECCICLSYPKQSLIKEFLDQYGGYKIYYPDFLIDAIHEALPEISHTTLDCNLFTVISILLGFTQTNNYQTKQVTDSKNPLLRLKKWLNDETCTDVDFSFIERIISFLSPKAQFLIIKRYFKAIHSGHYTYDPEFLKRLSDNKYHRIQTYRNSIYFPSQTADLTVPVLIDSIDTYIKSNGTRLQQFEGILDQFTRNADPLYLNADLGLHHLLPVCDGGAVYNQRHFKGFIDFCITFRIKHFNESQEQTKAIYDFLDRHFERVCITGCKSGKFKNQLKYCLNCEHVQSICNRSIQSKYCANCTMNILIAEKWIISPNHYARDIIKNLISTDFSFTDESTVLSIEMIDSADFTVRLYNYLCQLTRNTGPVFSIDDNEMQHLKFISEFIIFHNINFKIRENSYFGMNILNIRNNNCTTTSYDSPKEIAKEKNLVRQILQKSLEEELGTTFNSSGIIEIKYDETILNKVIMKYYYVPTSYDRTKDIPFLTKQQLKKKKFCAPEYENNYNPATSLPFFWCNGKECFKNSLSHQTLATVPSWTQYNLLHILEILGYPQMTETPAGLQPSPIIRSLIALINKVTHIIPRMSCRECGHLMYPTGKSKFNRYNYFTCCNPYCKEYNVFVYLNYCNSCKKGLIDSRDNAKCPNGWFICPSCLGCCNDNTINRMIQKYIVSGQPVPSHLQFIKGKGHNNKSIYYCPVCGEKLNNEVIKIHDNEKKDILICSQCGYKKTI